MVSATNRAGYNSKTLALKIVTFAVSSKAKIEYFYVKIDCLIGHANTKAFITHCGMGSITETVHFAVPAILLPVLAEQDLNANTIESRGAGIKYEITTLKKHEMEHAIKEIVNNKK